MDGVFNQKVNKIGQNSRRKKYFIEEAIKQCDPNVCLNRFDILDKVADFMCTQYKDENLTYHAKRMGMRTSGEILTEIDEYFYRDYEL